MGVVPASKVSQFPLSTPLPPSAMMTKTNSLPKSMRKQRKQASIFRSLSNKPLSTSPRNRVSSHKLTARCSQVSAPPVYKIGSCRHPATEMSVSYPSFLSPHITRNDEIGGTRTLCRVLAFSLHVQGGMQTKKPKSSSKAVEKHFYCATDRRFSCNFPVRISSSMAFANSSLVTGDQLSVRDIQRHCQSATRRSVKLSPFHTASRARRK